MIAFLRGTLAEKEPHQAVVDVGGVGYRVFVPFSTFERLPGTGEAVHLLTVTHVREDAFLLYGFASSGERALFEVLNTVSGIGAKLALATLSTLTPEAFALAVAREDVNQLARVPGVGKRIAMRLVVELKDRLPVMGSVPEPSVRGGEGAATPLPPADPDVALRADLTHALVNLGYRPPDAERALRTLTPGELADPALALRAALRILAR
ncbi:MAG: Holliday junction branch migration protein RuvA [Magnetococcales bacterium]|nr:Holliday junction branch migration protein RuvA [Magnetococcales bacterium]